MEDKKQQLVVIEEEKALLEAHKGKLSILRDGGMLPKNCSEKEAYARMCVGVEMGMRPMQALNGIAMIDGKPALHTDSIPSIIAASGLLTDQGHEFIGKDDDFGCRYWCKRKGLETVQEWTYSMRDAKAAGLLGRPIWRAHLRKMLFNRARTYCLRNTFPEVLGNMYDADEVSEMGHYEEVPDISTPAEEPKKRTRKTKLEEKKEIIDAAFEEIKKPETVEEKAAALDDEDKLPDLMPPLEKEPETEKQAPFGFFEE